MGRIIRLPDHLINRIAAGEVIERPASVLKELVENALDAGSDYLEVELDGGGRDRVVVRDRGCGMDKNDLILALERHATSKLALDTDLLAIPTLGFRGEAVPSIASVARVRILTRPVDAEAGHQALVEAGRILEVSERGAPVGTEVEVTRLFANVPARRKFLRAPDTEKGYALQEWSELALGAPAVHFRLIADGKELYNLPPATDLAARAKPFFPGIDPKEWRRPAGAGPVRVTGLLAPPTHHQAGWSGLYIYINGRAIPDKLVRYAVLDGYRNQLPARRFPRGVVRVELPPEQVDVNVHPQKAEVRFRAPQEVRAAVTAAVAAALAAVPAPKPAVPAVATPSARKDRPPLELKPEPFAPGFDLPRATPRREPGTPAPRPAVPLPAGERPHYRLIGAIRHSFLVVERADGVYLVDQHAAHERQLFDKLQATDRPVSQGLLLPTQLELSPAELLLAREWLPTLAELGFGIEPFGGNDLLVTAVPAALGQRAHDRRLLIGVLEETLRERDSAGRIARLKDHLARTIACKAAVKAGEALQPEEMAALCDYLFAGEGPWTCPHGRPIVWPITWDELARHFAR